MAVVSLGNSVYQLTYDTPIRGIPPVNGYLILGDKPVLIDGGTNDDKTYQLFLEDLKSLKLAPADLGSILVTHNHIDHIGLPSRLAKEVDAPVYVHRDEWFMVTASDEQREEFRATLKRTFVFWGVPPEVLELIKHKLLQALRFGGGIPREKVVHYPEKLDVHGVKLESIHCPGHTEGLVCLWWPDQKAIFSNDHVLETISPNPTIYLQGRDGKRCGLGDYLKSLSNIEHLPVKTIYPGHGHPFHDLQGRLNGIRGFAAERRDKILKILRDAEGKRLTILEVTALVWGELDPLQTFLAAREVHGFMEIFLEEGLVSVETRDDVGQFGWLSSRERAEAREMAAN
jgi:glyoxylase-like metal-dependent hydrolase (beta-lactamase superfamily II)